MKNNRIYIAGRISGDAEFREKFERAERYLTEHLEWKWWEVVNPVRECPDGWLCGGRLPLGGHAAGLEREQGREDRALLGAGAG